MVSWGVEAGLAWTVTGAARLRGAVGSSATVAGGLLPGGLHGGLPDAEVDDGLRLAVQLADALQRLLVNAGGGDQLAASQDVHRACSADGGGRVYSQRVQSVRVLQVCRQRWAAAL